MTVLIFIILLTGIIANADTNCVSKDSITKVTEDGREINAFVARWYVEHYTGLENEDIKKLKEEWDKNQDLHHDPNIQMRKP
jgi:hypothetical protein